MLIGATCAVFASASATTRRFFFFQLLLDLISGIINMPIRYTTKTNFFFRHTGGSINDVICNATCVTFFAASATSCCMFFSANCAGLFATSTTGSGTARHGNTATCKQANDSDSGKNLFQFLYIHG